MSSVVSGYPHLLLVTEFDPDNPDDCFDIKHFDDCAYELSDFAGVEVKSYTCAVASISFHDGVGVYFRHQADDSESMDCREVLAPGKYLVEAWQQVDYWGEWDGGLRLVKSG